MIPVRFCSKHYFFAIATIALAYWLSGKAILLISAFSGDVSPVWPAAGIAMAALILVGRNCWPGIAIGSLFLDFGQGLSILSASGMAVGSVGQAIVGVTLLQWTGMQFGIPRLQDALRLIGLAAIFSSTINATISTLTLLLVNHLEPSSIWVNWFTFWLGDGMGILIVTPIFMLLSRAQQTSQYITIHLIEAAVWLFALVGTSWFIFHQVIPINFALYPIEYIPFLLVIGIALRLNQLIAMVSSSVIAVIAILGVLHGEGPFVSRAELSDHAPIVLVQAFLAVIFLTTLLLSTAIHQQRTTQKQLNQSEESLRSAQRIARLGHWNYDLSTHQWNPSYELQQLLKNTSISIDQNSSRNWMMGYICDSDRDRVQFLFERAIGDRQPYVTQYCLTLPNGETRYMIEQVEANQNYVTGTLQDVTEQAYAEYALRESEEKFSKAFGFSPDPMTISTLDEGRFIDVNESFLNLFGYQQNDVINHTVDELQLWVHPSDRQWLIDQLKQHRSVRNQEFEFRIRSGQSIVALISAEIIVIHNQQYLLVIARDVTEQKRSDEALRLSMERDRLLGKISLHIRQTLNIEDILDATVHEVRSLLQASRVFIGQFQPSGSGKVVAESVDPEFPSLMGESINKNIYQEASHVFKHMPIVAVDNTENLDQFPGLSFLQECVERFQVKATLGVPIIVNDSLYGILVAHHCDTPRSWQIFEKELLEQLAIQVAIAIQQAELYTQVQQLNEGLESQVKERTQQLQEKMVELTELNELRDMFLHTMSHDLMTTVKGNLLVLKSLQSQDHDPVHLRRQCLERMIKAGECQLNKLNSLKEAYTFKTEGIHLRCTNVNIQTILNSVLTRLNPLVEKNQAVINLQICSDDYSTDIYADPLFLSRVLDHLLRNAIIHNPPGVIVNLELTSNTSHLVWIIRDDGNGIPQALQDRLFKLCLGTSENSKLTGVSLGLYFCHQVIEAHGGKIQVVSNSVNGTIVTVFLPLLPSNKTYECQDFSD